MLNNWQALQSLPQKKREGCNAYFKLIQYMYIMFQVIIERERERERERVELSLVS